MTLTGLNRPDLSGIMRLMTARFLSPTMKHSIATNTSEPRKDFVSHHSLIGAILLLLRP